jgi:hypothetical protein
LFKKVFLPIILIFISIQLIPVDKSNPPVDEKSTLKTQSEIIYLLKRSCYDCHSHETKWPFYSNIAPMSFVISSHVKDARKAMNFSKWNEIESNIKKARIKRAIKTINNEMMALPSYVSLHKKSKLTQSQKDILTKWFQSELIKLK